MQASNCEETYHNNIIRELVELAVIIFSPAQWSEPQSEDVLTSDLLRHPRLIYYVGVLLKQVGRMQ